MTLDTSIAVAIPTKNRADDLDLTVETVFSQSALPRQLIIVDQSTDDLSAFKVKARFEALRLEVKHSLELIYLRDLSLSGLTAARNRAMKAVNTEIILFLDDDVVLERDFNKRILEAYRDHPEAVGISGIVTNYSPPPLAFRWWAWFFMRGPFRDDRQSVYWRSNRLRHCAPIRVSRLGGGLMSFRMAAIKDLLFDEALHGACDGEDVEFCARLFPRPLFIAPAARLVHKRTPTGRDGEHWLVKHARTSCYLYLRNWNDGLSNQLRFFWLNVGYRFAAALISMRLRSFTLWNGLSGAIHGARALVNSTPQITRDLNSVAILTTYRKGGISVWLERVDLMEDLDAEIARTWNKSLSRISELKRDVIWACKVFRRSKHYGAVVTGSDRISRLFAILQLLFRTKRVPHVYIDWYCNLTGGRLRRRVQRLALKWAINGASRAIVQGRKEILGYADGLGVPDSKFVFVHYHATLYDIRFNVEAGDYIFAGGDSNRDYRTLIEAVRGLPWRTVIAALRRDHFRGIEVPNNVEIVSLDHDAFLREMARAALVVVPLLPGLLHSGGQQTWINAMSMGKAVIVAEDRSASDYLNHGLTGWVVQPGQPSELREAIRRLMQDDDMRSSIGKRAKDAAFQFSPEHFCAEVLAITEACAEDF